MVKGGRIEQPTAALRRLLEDEAFVFLPVAYDALGARLVERLGFKAVYTGGFVTGSTRCTSEPLLTMDEQVRVAWRCRQCGAVSRRGGWRCWVR